MLLYYTRLCFNIRARWDYLAFMARLLHPGFLQPLGNEVAIANGKELSLIRAAYSYGSAGVFKALRIDSAYPSTDSQGSVKELHQEIAREATHPAPKITAPSGRNPFIKETA